ncbi:hypothetical protein AAVH_33534, partial [Aphelenchoides avenae]
MSEPLFFTLNCTAEDGPFCFTLAYTDPAVVKNQSLSVVKGCDSIDRMCTRNGFEKFPDHNLYCCDVDDCNDLVCNDRGECSSPPLTTTPKSLDVLVTSIETTT